MADSFADWIRGLRRHLGMGQVEFARRFGLEQGTISRWESGLSRPQSRSRGILYDLAKGSGYPVDALALAIDRAPAMPARTTAPVVGHVGAGARIFPFDDYTLGSGMDEVEAPSWIDGSSVAVEIRGDSMHPMQDGWLLFYQRREQGVPEDCLNKLCVCKVADDGPTLVKEVRRGTRPGHFNLISWNAPPLEDQPLEWAARVIDIRPR